MKEYLSNLWVVLAILVIFMISSTDPAIQQWLGYILHDK